VNTQAGGGACNRAMPAARATDRECGNLSVPWLLAVARKQATSQEILLWMTPSDAPKA